MKTFTKQEIEYLTKKIKFKSYRSYQDIDNILEAAKKLNSKNQQPTISNYIQFIKKEIRLNIGRHPLKNILDEFNMPIKLNSGDQTPDSEKKRVTKEFHQIPVEFRDEIPKKELYKLLRDECNTNLSDSSLYKILRPHLKIGKNKLSKDQKSDVILFLKEYLIGNNIKISDVNLIPKIKKKFPEIKWADSTLRKFMFDENLSFSKRLSKKSIDMQKKIDVLVNSEEDRIILENFYSNPNCSLNILVV